MKNYLGRVLAGILVLNTMILLGQQETIKTSDGIVVISEANISSLTATLKTYKKKKQHAVEIQPLATVTTGNLTNDSSLEIALVKQDIARLDQELIYIKAQISRTSQKNFYESSGNKNMNDVKDELSELKFKINQLSNEKNNEPIIITTVDNKPVNRDIMDSLDNNEVLFLKRRLDSLYNTLNAPSQIKAEDYSGNFDSLKDQLNKLKSELESKNNTPTDYSLLLTKYKDFQKRIYFANNSTALNIETGQIIEDIKQILDANDIIDVLIKGFASNKGSAASNEKLSMLRTEEVKKALVIKGIHPTRILTQYHGIDYNSKDESDARRVEISLLVGK